MQQLFTSIITTALAEDIGAGDITSQLTIPEGTQASARFVAREPLVVAGIALVGEVYAQLGGENRLPLPNPPHFVEREYSLPPLGGGELERGALAVRPLSKDGDRVAAGAVLAEVRGDARMILTGERVALNLLQRACGVATLTKKYVDAVAGTKAIILDTRKTMPGLRALDKYAVTCGGGQNHRMRLDDMVLVKDNHLGIRHQALGIREVVEDVRKNLSLMPNAQSPIPIVVECDTLVQVVDALAARPDRILLDNMSLDELREAVRLSAGSIALEASGGVNLNTVRAIAETGVDYISVGALTHSASAVDVGLDL